MKLVENKVDLSRILSGKLLARDSTNKISIVGGEFEEEDQSPLRFP